MTYHCPIHGTLPEDNDPAFDRLWKRVGCVVCYLEARGKHLGLPAFPSGYEPRLAGEPVPEGTKAIRLASIERFHNDDIEKACSACNRPVFLRPFGAMNIPLFCLMCGFLNGIIQVPEGPA
jgi:hypothetical protein